MRNLLVSNLGASGEELGDEVGLLHVNTTFRRLWHNWQHIVLFYHMPSDSFVACVCKHMLFSVWEGCDAVFAHGAAI